LGYADDWNCLAQLTVVLKLNQGAGNGRKSLPVCFSLVLSFAQAKESTYKTYLNCLSVLFALMQKEPKKSSPARCFPIAIGTGRASAHEHSEHLKLHSVIEVIGRSCCFVLFEKSKGAVFFARIL